MKTALERTLAAVLFVAACTGSDGGDELTKDEARAQGKADGRDYCDERGWYGDGECDDFCAKRDQDCASDARTPELGDDPGVVFGSRITMSDALARAEAEQGVNIEAKFELDHAGALSLSLYPLGRPVTNDAERSVFQELAGDPTAAEWSPSLEVFHDQEHLTRSARDLTLVQLSRYGLRDAVAAADVVGFPYWAIPTIQAGRAGYGIYMMVDDDESAYLFVDGGGSGRRQVKEIGSGPGPAATDERVPELGDDPSVVRASKLSMSAALRTVEATHGPAIEAKFELDHDGRLSLSIYPVGAGIDVDAERNTFFELAGDPTATPFAPTLTEFKVPDEEHLTRSARDLTLVQTTGLSLLAAVAKVEARFPGGFVYWAIPTRRGTRAGYGIYVLAADGSVHYLFVS